MASPTPATERGIAVSEAVAASVNEVDCDMIPITRAARIIAPICHLGYRGGAFEGGWRYILGNRCNPAVQRQIVTQPPTHPFLDGHVAASPAWFSAIFGDPTGFDDQDGYDDFIAALFAWIEADGLLVSRCDVEAARKYPFGYHAPLENVDAVGASWNFAQTLAWIATRDPLEVAQMQHADHWNAPLDDSTPPAMIFRAMVQTDDGRRSLIGWLMIATAKSHCKCGSRRTDAKERWETCQCVGSAYVELRRFLNGTHYSIPEYRPKPAYASFTLTWPDGAHNLKFLREDVLAKWPVLNSRVAALAPQQLCEDWLREVWADDGHIWLTKDEYCTDARTHFQGLSERGFKRAWDAVAPNFGMNKPGRKRKQSVHTAS